MFMRAVTSKFVTSFVQNFGTSLPKDSVTFATSENGVAKITMCDFKNRNALSLKMMESLIYNIDKYEGDRDVRVIIIAAEGPVFSAGYNLKEMSPDHGIRQQNKIFAMGSLLMNKIIDCPVPIIARIDGLATAAGCQLVAQCDLAFCTEQSSFSTPGANFGIFCHTPGIALARCVPKSTALHMLFTGLPISSREAEAKGLIAKVCPGGTLDDEIRSTCQAIIRKSRTVVKIGKQFYYRQVSQDVKKAYEIGQQQMVDNLQLEDGQEGLRSFIEKRKPNWKQ